LARRFGTQLYNSGGTVTDIVSAASLNGIDKPNSNSAVTYTAKMKASGVPTTSIVFPLNSGANDGTGTIVLDEIMG
jgi:hypothetical protein